MDDANNPIPFAYMKGGIRRCAAAPALHIPDKPHGRHPGESRDPVTFAQRTNARADAMHRNAKALGPGYRFAAVFVGLQTRTPKAASAAPLRESSRGDAGSGRAVSMP